MANKPPAEGINFPLGEKADRSTTDSQKKLFAATFSAVGEDKLAQDVLNERNWRYNYNRHVLKHVQVSLKSPENAVNAAKAGLDWIYNNFEFIRDGKTYKFHEALKSFTGSYETGIIKGTKAKPAKMQYQVPYKGKQLQGEELVAQLKKWADYGTIEKDTYEAIAQVARNNEWVDLSDKYFVLLGAGSAMGPYSILMNLGANVIAVDLDREGIWKRLITIATNSPGTLIFPMKVPQGSLSIDDISKNAGGNLITHVPEINNWLKTVVPGKELTVGCYVYLDGEAHVKVALACDAIMKQLAETRKAGLAFLCTPTDAHVITDEARRSAQSEYSSFGLGNLLLMPIRLVTGKTVLAKNALPPVKTNDNRDVSIVDGLVVQQGPNYALAKRMQHWRAVVQRSSGNFVSSHIAPSTATASVVHNKQFAWAYDGMPFFRPFEIFDQDTSNAVMASILIYDLRSSKSIAQPTTPLKNPLEMFRETSFHGGVWRAGYKVGTIGEVSVIVHFIKVLRPVLLILLVALIAIAFRFFQK